MINNSIKIYEVNSRSADEHYISEFSHVIRREFGTVSLNGQSLNGMWVLRDSAGSIIDWHQYRNDLFEHHKFKIDASN